MSGRAGLRDHGVTLSALLISVACGTPDVEVEATASEETSMAVELAAASMTGDSNMVVFSTSLGDFTVELDWDKAPITVENFLTYVDDGFFDGTIFHRVIPGFMVQGGGFTEDMGRKTTRAAIKNEAENGLKNARGTLAMARTSDINSATAQFFVNLVNNTSLDHGSRDFGYAVFGKVVDGMDVIDKIAAVKTATRGRSQNVPVEAVVIQSARRK